MKHDFGNSLSPTFIPNHQGKQVHGIRCVEVLRIGQECGNADGFWTRENGIAVNVITADCVPILLSRVGERGEGQAVAALHAGWRGTFARVAEHFFSSLPKELADPQTWKAILGPSIRAECYEVSEELIAQFKAEFPGLDPDEIEPTPRKLDLVAVNQYQLKKLGVSEVEVHPDCTFCRRNSDGSFLYSSYRRGDRYARQYSWISL